MSISKLTSKVVGDKRRYREYKARTAGLPASDRGHAENHHLGGTAGRSGVVEQRGLTHPGLAPDHYRTALTPSGVPEQAVDHRTLASAPDEPRDPPLQLRATRHICGGSVIDSGGMVAPRSDRRAA